MKFVWCVLAGMLLAPAIVSAQKQPTKNVGISRLTLEAVNRRDMMGDAGRFSAEITVFDLMSDPTRVLVAGGIGYESIQQLGYSLRRLYIEAHYGLMYTGKDSTSAQSLDNDDVLVLRAGLPMQGARARTEFRWENTTSSWKLDNYYFLGELEFGTPSWPEFGGGYERLVRPGKDEAGFYGFVGIPAGPMRIRFTKHLRPGSDVFAIWALYEFRPSE